MLAVLAACVAPAAPDGTAGVAQAQGAGVAQTQGARGDPVAGRQAAFSRCLNCHSVNPSGQHGSAPNLFGLIGRTAGKAPGYFYSVPMGRQEFVWSEAMLAPFLRNPSRMVPGNAMNFQGVEDPVRRDIIAYLATLKR
jgi:cytochrome c